MAYAKVRWISTLAFLEMEASIGRRASKNVSKKEEGMHNMEMYTR
jgi:hypothetical protein